MQTMERTGMMKLFLKLPYPVSKVAYFFARKFLYPNGRAPHFDLVFRKIRDTQVAGDYLEFGVYRGTSFITAYYAAKRHGMSNMRFFAFDSFAGLPNDEHKFKKGDLACPEEVFTTMTRKAGVPTSRTIVVKGFYDQTLTAETKAAHNLVRAAVIHVDCDLYSSTKCVLEFIEDIVTVGSIVIFDDWSVFGAESATHGEQKAFGEWPMRDCFEPLFESVRGRCRGFVMARPRNA
jgi:O-methyltransferase